MREESPDPVRSGIRRVSLADRLKMPLHHGVPFGGRGGHRRFTPQKGPDPGEDPWVAPGSATDHDGITRTLSQKFESSGSACHVAVAHDWNLSFRFEPGHPAPVGKAGETLRPDAGVKRDGVDPAGFCDLGDLAGRDVFRIPAESDFDREGTGDCSADRIEDPGNSVRRAEQRRAGSDAADFLGRTTHVDIDQGCASVLGDSGSFGHLGRVCTKDLDAQGLLSLIELEKGESLSRAPDQSGGADHLGENDSGSVLPGDPAEAGVRVPGHGGQKDRLLNAQGADREGLEEKRHLRFFRSLYAFEGPRPRGALDTLGPIS